MQFSKRKIFWLIPFVILLIALPNVLSADAGPKPSVTIDLKGLEGKTYYLTLLSPTKTWGPYRTLDDGEMKEFLYSQKHEDGEILKKFNDYPAPQGFYFLNHFLVSSDNHHFTWSYYPPSTYKVLLYLPHSDRFIISQESYSNYAFSTYWVAHVEGNQLLLSKGYRIGKEMFSLFSRIIVTILVEVGIAWLFKIRTAKLRRLVVIVNVVTQVLLNVLLNFSSYHFGKILAVFVFLFLELLVFIIEAIIYGFSFRRLSSGEIGGAKAFVYAWAANTASMLVGFVMAYAFPSMF